MPKSEARFHDQKGPKTADKIVSPSSIPPDLGRLNAVGHLEESLPKRAVQATKRQCETSETIRSEEELQEVVAITGLAKHRERSVIDKAPNGSGPPPW